MNKALIYQADPDASRQLRTDMKAHGWSIDVYDGALEMLRLIERNKYNAVVLDVSHLNVEIYALLGAIKELGRNMKIFLNFPLSGDLQSMALLTLEYPVIEGTLTSGKLLKATRETA